MKGWWTRWQRDRVILQGKTTALAAFRRAIFWWLGDSAATGFSPRNLLLAAFIAGTVLGWHQQFVLSAVLVTVGGLGFHHHARTITAGFAAGLLIGHAAHREPPPVSTATALLTVEVAGLPVRMAGVWWIDTKVISAGHAEVPATPLEPGDRVRLELRGNGSSGTNPWRWVRTDRLTTRARVYPLVPSFNPGAFDRDRYLAQKGFRARAVADLLPDGDGGPAIVRTPSAHWIAALDRFRLAAGRELNRHGPGGRLLAALALGLRNGVDPATTRQMNRLGLAHLLSISGVHFTMFAIWVILLIELVLGRSQSITLRLPVRRIAVGLAVPVLFSYTVLTGAQTGTVRAFIMFLAASGAVIAGRRHAMADALLLAAALMLLHDPSQAGDLSFQLSFLSMLGIALVPSVSAGAAESAAVHPLRKLVTGSVVMSAAATLLTAPLVISTFHQLPLSGLAANAVILPVIETALLPAGVIGTLAAGILPDTLRPYLPGLLGPICQGLDGLIRTGDRWLPGPLPLGAPPATATAVFYLLAALSALALRNGRTLPAFLTVILATTVLVFACHRSAAHERITVLDGPHSPGLVWMRPGTPPLWLYPGTRQPPNSLLRTVHETLAHHGVREEVIFLAPRLRMAERSRFHWRDQGFRRTGPEETAGGIEPVTVSGETLAVILNAGGRRVLADFTGTRWRPALIRPWGRVDGWVCLAAGCSTPAAASREETPIVMAGPKPGRMDRPALWTRTHGQVVLEPARNGFAVQTARMRPRTGRAGRSERQPDHPVVDPVGHQPHDPHDQRQ